jgi:Lrp/AsnC family transcriptional regulator, leucine-responsive regulatory protein
MRQIAQAGKGLDKIDRNILRTLQADARLSMTELADKVGLSITPCAERVKRLEREGYILGHHTKLNPHKLGQGLLVFVELKLAEKSGAIFDEFRRQVLALSNVLECHLVSGEFDYLIKARIPEISAYRKLLGERLLALPGARESRTLFVMEEIKESLAIEVEY